jgi:hypothetical protein
MLLGTGIETQGGVIGVQGWAGRSSRWRDEKKSVKFDQPLLSLFKSD